MYIIFSLPTYLWDRVKRDVWHVNTEPTRQMIQDQLSLVLTFWDWYWVKVSAQGIICQFEPSPTHLSLFNKRMNLSNWHSHQNPIHQSYSTGFKKNCFRFKSSYLQTPMLISFMTPFFIHPKTTETRFFISTFLLSCYFAHVKFIHSAARFWNPSSVTLLFWIVCFADCLHHSTLIHLKIETDWHCILSLS